MSRNIKNLLYYIYIFYSATRLLSVRYYYINYILKNKKNNKIYRRYLGFSLYRLKYILWALCQNINRH